MVYTNTQLVESELRASTHFSVLTVPSISDVTNWISEESALIDRDFRRSFGITQTTSDLDYARNNLDGDTIMLKFAPVITVDTVLYSTTDLGDAGYPAWVAKVEDVDYTVYKDSGEISLLQNFNPSSGRKKFRVIYTYGYTQIPLIVQRLCTKMVALRVLDTLLYSNVSGNSFGGSTSIGDVRIVDPANYGINAFGKLKDDIDRIYIDMVKVFGVYRYNG